MKRALRVLLIACAIGTAFGLYFYFTGKSQTPAVILSSVLFSFNIGSLMMLVIYKREFMLAHVPYAFLKMLFMILALATAAVLGTEFTRFIQATLLLRQEYAFGEAPNLYFLNILIVLVTGLPIYQQEEWKKYAVTKIVKQQYDLLKLEQLSTQAELEMLRAKINPHFLYNVHNTIAGLIHSQPDKAEQMVVLLSRFFRFTLTKSSSNYNSVQEELEIAQTYLQLQQIRFGERMQLQLQIDKSCLSESVPSFILQPLVENAVKHSIEKISQVGEITIRIQKEKNILVLEVGDNGLPFTDNLNLGFGLEGIISKLKLLYPQQHTISFLNKPYKHVRLELQNIRKTEGPVSR